MREKTNYNYSKLLGKMREKGFTQEDLARKLNISAVTLNLALNNKRGFKQDEILAICATLDIGFDEIPSYFFCHRT